VGSYQARGVGAYLNVDSPLSVASQCKLVLSVKETEISATLGPSRE